MKTYIYEIENDFNSFHNKLKENDYLLLEEIILENNFELLNFILKKFEEINENNFLKIFKPGFFRNEKILKRQIPSYLVIVSQEETRYILLTHYKTRNIILKYWNDNIIYN